ncbi:MAG: glycosyltransferase family 2 protein [Dorea sp.]|jgi:glycosyltransferase involved in cell wall biosynthesis|nr:glycosyltransferase family 2 protein [Dorea sp.]
MKLLSVIVPVYNEEKMIPRAAAVISDILVKENINYELLFINDGSKDMSWPAITEECHKNPKVKGICFSRNFGKESAMFAGLECAEGDCAVIMDCDLQHPPEKIVEMYRIWQEGKYDLVEGVKSDRGQESFLHRFCAKAFYKIISRITKINMENASDFKLMDRKVIDVLTAMPERNVFFRALSSWIGFKSTQVTFEVREREEGVSKWSTWSLVKYAFSNIVSFSAAPMQIVTILGAGFFVLAAILGVQSLIYKFIGKALAGFTTVIIIVLLLGSIMMISMGIIGYYISKMYEELKERPKYIIVQKLNENRNRTAE